MSDTPLLSRSVLIVLLSGAVAIFAISMLLALTAPSEPPGVGADTRSISALGQEGLFALLQQTEIPVARSQINGVVAPGNQDVLVLAEPPPTGLSGGDVVRLGRARNVLLVLPKRTGTPDINKLTWVDSTSPVGIDQVADIAKLIDQKIDIVRTDPPKAWDINRLGAVPSFDDTVQLIESDDLVPIVANGKQMLVGEYRDGDHRTWIVADPDFLENHGLAKGQNADVAIALFNGLRGDDGTVIFDETIHGMVNVVVNPFRKLLEFPLVIASVLCLVAAALLLWATVGRFGKPGLDPPAFDFGKRRLISTSASLLDRAGHQSEVMRRYIEQTLRDVGRALGAPGELGDTELAAWLDGVASSRGIDAEVTEIVARSQQAQGTKGGVALSLFAAAGDIHQWKTRISDGTSGHRRDR
jgi:hypothetical protein